MTLSVHTKRQMGYAEGYLLLGMHAAATQALDEIAPAERESLPVLMLGLAVHIEAESWLKAAAIGAMLCERQPDVPECWIQWAYATRRAESLNAARAILLRGVARHPRVAVFHFNLACYEAQLGQLNDARTFLEIACKLDPAFAELAKTDADLEPIRGRQIGIG